MRKNRYKYGFILILLIGLLITACSNDEESPEEIFETYTSYWMEEDYRSMYEILSSGSKEYISEEDFISRYENIYSGIGGENISITFDNEEELLEEDGEVEIDYEFYMDSIVGSIEFEHSGQLVKNDAEDGERWTIKWDESMIFPQMEEGDQVNVVTTAANRGKIIDRQGITLADNGEIQTIGIVPQDLGQDGESTKEILADAFQMTVEDIENKLQANWVKPDLFVPIGSLSLDDESKILDLTALPGVLAQRQVARVYPFKEATAHLIGYIASISAEELEELETQGYNQQSIIGKAGLEQLYEETLRARDGKNIRILDKDKKVKDILGEVEAKDGQDIQLTIDALLQEQIYEEMNEDKGTAVAMNSSTGQVLALVNKPAYDPNGFILGLSNQEWNNLNEDPDRPLSNRFSQRYSPGSVFKPIVAAIALENGNLDPNDTMDISGLQWQKDQSWGDYNIRRVSDPGRPVNLRDALVYSDNIYFANVSLEMGEDEFLQGGRSFGIGEEIDFDYPITSSQLTSDESFSNEIELADSGYGQGQVETSPLHLTAMYTSFLNEGNMLRPSLIKGEDEGPIFWKEGVISSNTAQIIKDDLIQVVENPQGTGNAAKIEGRVLGGKTGTAEFKENQGEEGIKNGWFLAFDSQENIIVTMMLEEVAGSSTAIPKVKNIIENYQP